MDEEIYKNVIVEYKGWSENGRKTDKFMTILNFKQGEKVTKEDFLKQIGEQKDLSSFRKHKEIEIISINVF